MLAMKLYIAEKPSLGRAIAEALPGPQRKGDGYIQASNGDVVSWCIGHLLEQAEPEAYDPSYKKWRLEDLPILPQTWQLKVKKQTAKQFGILKKWIQQADQLVHAGDPDREGQLLVDEVIHYVGVRGAKHNNIQRCLINDLNTSAVKQALENLRPNRDFSPLSKSALARSRADWLYGINLTRAYTLQGQQSGFQGVLSIGRVQTPILGLIAQRDQQIDNFVTKAYFEVFAVLDTSKKQRFKAKWQPSDSCAAYLDEQGRSLSKPLAENVARRISDQEALVEAVTRKKKSPPPPLPHALSSLQIEANKVYGYSAQQVLDLSQALYERHKLITYPRSDSRYLPREHHQQALKVVESLKHNLQHLQKSTDCQKAYSELNLDTKSKAWNDSKVEAHHAIIPTQRRISSLSEQESNVYALVCRHYLAQFLPHHLFEETQASIRISGGLFVAKGKVILQAGWKVMFPNRRDDSSKNQSDSEESAVLPPLRKGQTLHSRQAEVIEKKTQPPKAFTDASLLSAMTGIARFVADEQLRKILKDTHGLGTEATRASIIELLFNRGFITRQAKNIRTTALGKAFIDALPSSLTLPDRTAHWEYLLANICERKAEYDTFMQPLQTEIGNMIRESRKQNLSSVKDMSPNGNKSARFKKKGGKPGLKRARKPRAKVSATKKA